MSILHDTAQKVCDGCFHEENIGAGFGQALMLPGVVSASMAYACVKSMQYCLIF